MAIDSGDYPVLKKSFRPEGQRRFFYVGRFGRFGDEKGINLLERLAATIPGFSGGYICEGGDIAGWSKISEPTRLTPEFVSDLANSYDFFINMSRADAQATTVLEALSWGFPVACTRESGYMDDSLFLLDIDDLAQNVATIVRMQHLQCEELERISQVNRMLVETKYNWQQFTRVLANNIT
jgi:glycosyltransferase involved in cell wall biosynthesis